RAERHSRFWGLPGLPNTRQILPKQPPRVGFTGHWVESISVESGKRGIGGQVNSKCESPGVPGDNYPERSASITLSGWRAGSPTEAFASPVGLIGLVSSDDRRGRCQADASMTN